MKNHPPLGNTGLADFSSGTLNNTLKRQKALDLEHKRAESYENLKDWFQLLQDVIMDLGIDSDSKLHL
jgi:hypothetical protein